MKIALDFDGVLSHTMKAWVIKYNEKTGKTKTIRDIEKWGFYEDLGISMDECFAIFDEAWSDYNNLEPMEQDTWQKTKMLKNLGTLDVVTNVNPDMKEQIVKWLFKHAISYDKIVFNREKWKLDYDVFIDDSPSNIEKMFELKKIVLMYNQPWNRQVREERNYWLSDDGGIFRVYNLYHAIDIMRKIIIPTMEKNN